MWIQRQTTIYYMVDVSRDEAIALIKDHDPHAWGLGDVSCAGLKTLLVATANVSDDLSDHLDDLAYETDSGTGPWEA